MSEPKCCQWVFSQGGEHPKFAVQGGIDGSSKLYVIRAHHQGALVPGKLHVGHTCAYISYAWKEVPVYSYEVLLAPPGSLSWVSDCNGRVPANAIVGGYAAGGEPYYVGRVIHNGTVTNGKVHPSLGGCFIPYGGKEHSFMKYEVLVKNLYGQHLNV